MALCSETPQEQGKSRSNFYAFSSSPHYLLWQRRTFDCKPNVNYMMQANPRSSRSHVAKIAAILPIIANFRIIADTSRSQRRFCRALYELIDRQNYWVKSDLRASNGLPSLREYCSITTEYFCREFDIFFALVSCFDQWLFFERHLYRSLNLENYNPGREERKKFAFGTNERAKMRLTRARHSFSVVRPFQMRSYQFSRLECVLIVLFLCIEDWTGLDETVLAMCI